MDIKYKVMEKNPSENQLVVRFYTAAVTEEQLGGKNENGDYLRGRTDLAMNLPIPTPTGKDLEDYILQFAPAAWLEMMEKVQDGAVPIDFTSITLGVEKTAQVTVKTTYSLPKKAEK